MNKDKPELIWFGKKYTQKQTEFRLLGITFQQISTTYAQKIMSPFDKKCLRLLIYGNKESYLQ